jgi:hypothetical protein
MLFRELITGSCNVFLIHSRIKSHPSGSNCTVSELYIKKAEKHNFGTYNCHARNKYGSDKSSVTLDGMYTIVSFRKCNIHPFLQLNENVMDFLICRSERSSLFTCMSSCYAYTR